jgi:hypothetical protein
MIRQSWVKMGRKAIPTTWPGDGCTSHATLVKGLLWCNGERGLPSSVELFAQLFD